MVWVGGCRSARWDGTHGSVPRGTTLCGAATAHVCRAARHARRSSRCPPLRSLDWTRCTLLGRTSAEARPCVPGWSGEQAPARSAWALVRVAGVTGPRSSSWRDRRSFAATDRQGSRAAVVWRHACRARPEVVSEGRRSTRNVGDGRASRAERRRRWITGRPNASVSRRGRSVDASGMVAGRDRAQAMARAAQQDRRCTCVVRFASRTRRSRGAPAVRLTPREVALGCSTWNIVRG